MSLVPRETQIARTRSMIRSSRDGPHVLIPLGAALCRLMAFRMSHRSGGALTARCHGE